MGFKFEKNSQLEPKMGTSQQPEPKLRTGIQLQPDPDPELTPERIAYNFWFFTFLNFKLKLSSCFFPSF
jgi:hypothetical protein